MNHWLEKTTDYKMEYSRRYADRKISDFARFLDRAFIIYLIMQTKLSHVLLVYRHDI